MNKSKPRSKLQLDTQTVRRLNPDVLRSVGGARPKTSFISVIMQCDSMTCPSYSCFVDETCFG